ncbi:hypothetical protein D3C80_850860 [compost metagenome]
MSGKTPDIDQLQELALPPAISYMPQTWGWWLLLGLLLAGVLAWAAHLVWQWRRNRYRREALVQLHDLQGLLDTPDQRVAALRQLPELLKRVALSMPTRPAVANLTGADWQAFLERTSKTPLPKDFARQLADLAYAPAPRLHALADVQARQLLTQCQHWVETHHVAA